MNKRLQQIDSETGEIIDGFVAYVVPKRKNGFGQGWFSNGSKRRRNTGTKQFNDFKVLMKLLSVLDYPASKPSGCGTRTQHASDSTRFREA